MDLTTYQPHALATAKPTALNLDGYLIPNLISEVGEVFGKIAKAHRDGWDETRRQAEVGAEWGDCAWMTAVALDVLDVHEHHPQLPLHFTHAEDVLDALLDSAAEARAARHPDHQADHLLDVWEILEAGCELLTGRTLPEILAGNIGKLADRADRDVISGSGDHR